MESYDENPTPPGGGRMAVAPPAALSTEVPTPPGTELPPDLRTIVAAQTEQERPRTPSADTGSNGGADEPPD